MLLLLIQLPILHRLGKLRLCGINTGAWGVFLVTGLDKLFEFCDDAASGLASVQLG